jgi:hypothetical protein
LELEQKIKEEENNFNEDEEKMIRHFKKIAQGLKGEGCKYDWLEKPKTFMEPTANTDNSNNRYNGIYTHDKISARVMKKSSLYAHSSQKALHSNRRSTTSYG